MVNILLLVTAHIIPTPTHPSLAVNGDFSAGNAGFASEYSYSKIVGAEGSYFIGKDPHDSHPGGASFGDHTTGTGPMLIANGSPNSGTVVWKQTINVAPHHTYWFGVWAASWGQWNSGDNDPSPARLIVTINGKPLGPTFFVRAKDGAWSKFAEPWASGGANAAEIRIVDQNLEGIGNDFAIDDISFHR